jgi:hypothetical protein
MHCRLEVTKLVTFSRIASLTCLSGNSVSFGGLPIRGRRIMRRVLLYLAASVLATGMAMAQTSSGTAADQGANPSTSGADQSGRTNANKPSTAGAGQNADATRARSSNAEDNMKQATQNPNGQAGANGNQDNSAAAASGGRDEGKANADAARSDSADASNQASNPADTKTAKTNGTRAGVPWMWIALGIVALIVIFSLFGGSRTGPERSDRGTKTDRNRVTDIREGNRRDDDIRRVG